MTIATEAEPTRHYSQRQMQPGSIMEKSETTQRRVKGKAFHVLKEAFNCEDSQVPEIAKLVCTPHISALKTRKDNTATSDTSSSISFLSPESQLRPACLESCRIRR